MLKYYLLGRVELILESYRIEVWGIDVQGPPVLVSS